MLTDGLPNARAPMDHRNKISPNLNTMDYDFTDAEPFLPNEKVPEIAMNFEDFDFDMLDFQKGIQLLREEVIAPKKKVYTPDNVESNPKLLSENLPEIATNVAEVDAMIAKQMMAMSVEDREKVYMDVHGVNEGPLKTEDEAIQTGLESMQIEIEKLQDKDAYELALSMDREYVEDRSLRVAFLRSEYFDAKKAAIKIVRHFQLKLELFGKEKLALDIVQDDLDRDTIDALYSGRGQYLEARDRAGRYILLCFFGDVFAPKAILQRAFYNTMIAMRDPEKQIHGHVVVTFALNNGPAQGDNSKQKIWNFSKMTDGVPVRFEALHFCSSSPVSQEMFAVSKAAINGALKTRTRTHHGSRNEILASLAQYGIAPGTIPVTEGFKLTNAEAYEQHLNELRLTERLKQPRRQRIFHPSKQDVLFGKGRPFQVHPGNIVLRSLVAERFKSYEKAAKGVKMKIAQEIVETIQEKSGLFLRPDDDDSWVCVQDGIARQKVGNLFRTLRLHVGNK